MNLKTFLLTATDATTTTTAANGTGTETPWYSTLLSFLPIILIFVLMYFVMIRPQRKQQKEEQKMRNSLRVGDEISTIGGICGRVVNIKEDRLIIETGADRSKITILKAAVANNATVHDAEDVDDDDDDDDDDDI